MLNLSSVILDSRFSGPFKVYRKSGEWIKGRFIQDEKELDMDGVITPAKPKEIEMIPEGDRVGGEISVYTTQKLYTTHSLDSEDTEGTSDEIEWHGERYKLYSVKDLSQFGYYSAIGIRMVSC